MTDGPDTVRLHVEAAFEIARRHAYEQFKAERSAELRDKRYSRWDGRGLHALSLEVGRMFALSELCAGLIPAERLDVQQLRNDAREDATAEWRDEVWRDFTPAEDAA